MCEANVYIFREGREELVMEKVDRIIPGQDDHIFMENIFGERRVVRARIKEMELVHHRILLDEIQEAQAVREHEIWLEPETDHGHFHAGEEVTIKVLKGYNMKPADFVCTKISATVVSEGSNQKIDIHEHHGQGQINLGQEADGLLQVFIEEHNGKRRFGKIIMEIGHHHHHGLDPLGLPLEIVPKGHSHARMGESYELLVLKDGQPLPGAEIKATFTGTQSLDYPHRLVADSAGKAKLFLSARGNYLFSVSHEDIISTYTLIKSF